MFLTAFYLFMETNSAHQVSIYNLKKLVYCDFYNHHYYLFYSLQKSLQLFNKEWMHFRKRNFFKKILLSPKIYQKRKSYKS